MLTLANILEVVCLKAPLDYDDRTFTGVSIDSRTIQTGDVFIAIKGDRFDGHQFIDQAINKGAQAVIVQRTVDATDISVPVIEVPDTVVALGKIANWHRRRFRIPMIGITGSTRKTTTKNILQQVLKSRYSVLCSEKSFNNHIGVPLTLLQLNEQHEVAILELGSNQPGDIQYLTMMVEPTIAILTNVAEAHLEGLRDLRGVYHEKTF